MDSCNLVRILSLDLSIPVAREVFTFPRNALGIIPCLGTGAFSKRREKLLAGNCLRKLSLLTDGEEEMLEDKATDVYCRVFME